MQERESPDSWTISSNEYGYIYARVNGQVIFGDGLRLTLNGKTDRCENAVLGTSWYIGPDPSNLANDLEDTVITVEAFGGEIEALIALVTEHGKGEKVAWVNIIKTDTADMEDVLGVMNEEFDTVEMTIKPTKSFRADKPKPSGLRKFRRRLDHLGRIHTLNVSSAQFGASVWTTSLFWASAI